MSSAGLLPRSPHNSSAAPLAWAYSAVIVYASWYPFTGWRWPPGQSLHALLLLPWPPWRDPFDLWANLLGFMPLGLLSMLALQRAGRGGRASASIALGGALALSFVAEWGQQFLPGRHPSLKDCAMNGLGAAIGTALAAMLHAIGAIGNWRSLRARWFVPRSGGGLALLALWPVALMVPAPVPLGLGQIGERLRDGMIELLDGVSWAEPLRDALLASAAASIGGPVHPIAEGLISAFGLVAPCMLAYSVARDGWHRAWLGLGASAIAVGAMTLSTLLNYGPHHALAWMTPASVTAVMAGMLASLAVMGLPRRVAAGLGLVALAGSVALAAQAPDDPYFAANLQSWEQGRFIHFHGMALWIAWLWPYMAIGFLLSVLARRD